MLFQLRSHSLFWGVRRPSDVRLRCSQSRINAGWILFSRARAPFLRGMKQAQTCPFILKSENKARLPLEVWVSWRFCNSLSLGCSFLSFNMKQCCLLLHSTENRGGSLDKSWVVPCCLQPCSAVDFLCKHLTRALNRLLMGGILSVLAVVCKPLTPTQISSLTHVINGPRQSSVLA